VHAVTALAEEMGKLDVLSQKKFEPLLEEFSRFHSILQEFIDICLEVQNQIQQADIPFPEYPVIPEIEKPEDVRDYEKNSVPSSVNNFLITVGPLQINSLARALGETFKEFETQTATLADIYNPSTYSEPSIIAHVPQDTVSGHIFEDTLGIGFERLQGSGGTDTIADKLNRSAGILHTLESIRTSMIRTYTERGTTIPGTPVSQGVTSTRAMSGNNLDGEFTSGSDLSNYLRLSPDRINAYPESLTTIFTGLHDMIKKSEEVADIPYPILIGGQQFIPPGTSLMRTGTGSWGQPLLTSRLPDTEVPYTTPGIKKPADRQSDKQVTAASKGIIEIPALLPAGKITLPSYNAQLHAVKLSKGLIEQYSGETSTPVLLDGSKGIPAVSHPVPQRLDYSLPGISIPHAFEKISEYLKYTSAIHHQITAPLYGSFDTTEFNPPAFSFTLPLSGGDMGSPLLPNLLSYGVNSMSAEKNPILNLAMNMITSDGMKRADLSALSAVGNGQLPLFPAEVVQGASPASVPRALEHVFQMFSGAFGDTAAPSSAGGNTFHFQNTFNIVVNTKAAGDERGLRELGRKIGVILSEEMKRYGGSR